MNGQLCASNWFEDGLWGIEIFRIVGEQEIVYTAELKVDGLSMALHYEGGRLARAVRAVRTDPVESLRAE